MWFQVALFVLGFGLVAIACLYNVNNALCTTPEEVEKLAGKPWSDDVLRAAYDKCRKEGVDFTQYLPPKQNRRYIVFGGSGGLLF
jgi:hypothetical protein